MAQKCSVCRHKKRQYINRMLVNPHNSKRVISVKYGVSRQALTRHMVHIGSGIVSLEKDHENQAYDAYGEFMDLVREARAEDKTAKNGAKLQWHHARRILMQTYFNLKLETLRMIAKEDKDSSDAIDEACYFQG